MKKLTLRLPFEDGQEFEFREPTLGEFDFYYYQALRAGQFTALEGMKKAGSAAEAKLAAKAFAANGQAIAEQAEDCLKATVIGEANELPEAIEAAGHQRTQVLVGAAEAIVQFLAPEEAVGNSSAGSSEIEAGEPEKVALDCS